MIFTLIVSAGLGLLVGAVMGGTGAGATILALPLLVFVFDLSLLTALPISLLAVMVTSGLATILGLKQRLVRYRATVLLAISGMLLAPVGVWLSHQLPDQALAMLFITVMFLVGYRSLVDSIVNKATLPLGAEVPCAINPVTNRLFWTKPCAQKLIATGGLAGFISGLLGIGGGFVIVPALYKVSNLEPRMVVATSLSVIAATSTVGMFMYSVHGPVNWGIAVPFVAGALAGMLLGRRVSRKMPGYLSQRIFAVITLITAFVFVIKMLIGD